MILGLLRLLIFFFLVTTIIISAQTNYYVSETGSNSNNGLTPQTAFETFSMQQIWYLLGDSVLVLDRKLCWI